MDTQGNSSSGQDRANTAIPSEETVKSNGAQRKARAKIDTKPKKKKPDSPKKKTIDKATLTSLTQIAIAIISVIGTITVAWFSYRSSLPPPTPIPSPVSTETSSPVPVFTDIPFTETLSPTVTPLPSLTSTITFTPSPSATATLLPSPKLVVLLETSKTSGRAPLIVKFDSRRSYLTDYDAQTYVCRDGACYYTWKVYLHGQQLGKSVNNSGGTFDYKFTKRGTYMVTVWICRGRDRVDCGGSGIQIVVT